VLSEVPAVVYTCDPRAPYPTTFITDNVLDEFGYSGAAVLADAEFWMDRIEPADCDMVREGLANLGESPVSLEYRFRCGDGTLRWLRDTVKLVRGASGEPEEIVGCAVDITDGKEVEERLAGAQAELEERVKELTEVNERLRREIMERKGTEARLRSITDNAPSYIIQVSRDGTMRFINRTLDYLSREEVVGSSVYDWQPPQYHERVRAALRQVFETGEPTTYEVEAAGEKPGTSAWYSSRVAPVFLDGEVESAIMIAVDISEQKKAEQFEKRIRDLQHEIEHATRLSTVGEMSASIAHELNQPLAAIVHYSGACFELLSSAQNLPRDVLRDNLDAASKQALRAGDIIKRLRAYTSKRDPHRSTLDINEAVTQVLPLLELERRIRAVPVELELDRTAPLVLADRIQLQQVLINLIRNAMEATEERGAAEPSVRVETASVAGGRVRVSVSDDGPGLPDADPQGVFEPFFTTKAGGMGLGLTIAKSIVEGSSGTLGARNGESGGAIFWFELPGPESG
jgi:two-component system sensor kinase FixL